MDFDLNVEYNPSMDEIYPTKNFLLDLNREPFKEEEENIHSEEQLDELVQGSLAFEEGSQQIEDGSLQMEEETVDNSGSDANRSKKGKELSNDRRRIIYELLLEKSMNGRFKKITPREVASAFSVSLWTIERIWKRGRGSTDGGVSSRKTQRGRKKGPGMDLEQFRALPRTTIQSAACALEISHNQVFRSLQNGKIKRHSNAIKPFLKEEHKRARLKYCLSMLEENSLPHDPTFKWMYNMVHINEKWFNMTRKNETYYLLPDEQAPIRTCKSKNFIGKVMFLAAVARPRFDAYGNETFSRKIGIFPFVKREAAKKNSVNRAAGTMEIKPINSVTRDHVRSCLIENVIPAIKQKWPIEDRMETIFIQQDNARTHVDPTDHEFCAAANKDGFDIQLTCQPANYPDLNILDLGFFNAIQSLQSKECATTFDELMDAVNKSFEEYSARKSNRIFLTLQQCMIEIMKERGEHNYKMQHINKEKLERESNLPKTLKCDASLVQDVMQFLV